jgi:hypothetical protein
MTGIIIDRVDQNRVFGDARDSAARCAGLGRAIEGRIYLDHIKEVCEIR